jgi:Do/DeqQ family serine protease
MKTKHKIISALAAVVLLAAVSVILVALPGQETSPSTSSGGSTGQAVAAPAATSAELPSAVASLEAIQLSFRDIAKRVLPVVVEIDVTETVTQAQGGSPFDFFNNRGGQGNQEFQRNGLGSGIIVQQNGSTVYVLTNNHVVESATEISVKLNDQRTFKAKVVGKDSRKDLAVVSFESKEALPVAELGNSASLEAGDLVLAVGNPFGFESSITMGIVSAVGRSGPEGQQTYTDYIQTDAAINQGNSGGALVDIRGRVVGVNTWIAAPTGGSVGLGFAIPIDNAKKSISDFITKGKVEYGWLGVQIGDLAETAPYTGFAKDLKLEGQKGALVVATYKGSPADRAGLLPGDYVVKIDGQDVRSRDNLTQIVGALAAGSTHQFELIRYGERQKLSVKIGVRDDKDEVAPAKNLWPGMTVAKLTDELRSAAKVAAGVDGLLVGAVTDPETPAAKAGFQPGDVIVTINGKSAKNVMEYFRALNDDAKRSVTFAVNRSGKELTIELPR